LRVGGGLAQMGNKETVPNIHETEKYNGENCLFSANTMYFVPYLWLFSFLKYFSKV
jgi:hypothetical protein